MISPCPVLEEVPGGVRVYGHHLLTSLVSVLDKKRAAKAAVLLSLEVSSELV